MPIAANQNISQILNNEMIALGERTPRSGNLEIFVVRHNLKL
jgi:hypothetical protein